MMLIVHEPASKVAETARQRSSILIRGGWERSRNGPRTDAHHTSGKRSEAKESHICPAMDQPLSLIHI